MRGRRLFLLMMLVLFCSGCSVGMALSGNEQKDTSVFYNGAERSFVNAKVGLPDVSVQDKDATGGLQAYREWSACLISGGR